jgi:hypothetical protein
MATPQENLGAIDGLFDPPRTGGITPRPTRKREPAPAATTPVPEPARASSHPYGAFDAQTDGSWSIKHADDLRGWFRQTYGRELPVTAEGQSGTHNRMGLDHSDSLDVGVNPTSDEGKALREYLRARGVPFLAYDRAVPDAATNAHIHVGFPSHRGAAGEAARLGSIGDLFDPVDSISGLFDPVDPARLADEEWAGGSVVTTHAAPGIAPRPAPLQRAALDVQTVEGRKKRDESNALAHTPGSYIEVATTIPPGAPNWQTVPGSDAVREAVLSWARQNNLDVQVAHDFIERTAPQGFSLYQRDGTPAATVADVLSDDSFDPKTNTLRVKVSAPYLAQLRDHAVLSPLFDPLVSPGEKVLDVAGAVAAPVAKGAGIAARPLSAVSGSVWAATRGQNPLREAGHVLRMGETTAAGETPVGTFLRDSQMLANINPRLGRLLGAGADMIVDPSNLLMVGAAGKVAKVAGRVGRAAEEVGALGRSLGMLERGVVEARPLGLMEEAASLQGALEATPAGRVAALEDRLSRVQEVTRKVRAGETLTAAERGLVEEVRAKHAPALPSEFDTELKGADGERLAHSTQTRETVDLTTGEPVPLDAPSPAVRSEQLRYVRERAEHYAREAAAAKHPNARRTAQELADDYAREVERLESPAPAEPAPDGLDVSQASAAPGAGIGPRPGSTPRPLWRRALSTAKDVVQLPKAKAGYDLSATGRQGLAQIAAHPTYLKEAFAEQVKAFASEDAFNSFIESIRSRPDFQQMKDAGLYLSHVAGDAVEEPFASKLARKIPGVRASDRAYSAALDSIRVQAWDNYVSSLPAHLRDSPDTLGAVADLINISTGRGKVALLDRSKLGRAFVDALNVPFFSPRNTASKFNLLSPARVIRNAVNPATRPVAWLQMRDAFRGLSTMGTTLGLAHVAGLDVGVDPRSSDFGKLRVGEAVYDLTGGEGFTVRYLASMARSFRAVEQGKKLKPRETPQALTLHYLRSQLQPLSSSGVDLATGETYEGEPATLTDAALNQIVPFVVEDALKGYHAEGWKGAAKSLPGVLGVGVGFYPKKGSGRGAYAGRRASKKSLAEYARQKGVSLDDAVKEAEGLGAEVYDEQEH